MEALRPQTQKTEKNIELLLDNWQRHVVKMFSSCATKLDGEMLSLSFGI